MHPCVYQNWISHSANSVYAFANGLGWDGAGYHCTMVYAKGRCSEPASAGRLGRARRRLLLRLLPLGLPLSNMGSKHMLIIMISISLIWHILTIHTYIVFVMHPAAEEGRPKTMRAGPQARPGNITGWSWLYPTLHNNSGSKHKLAMATSITSITLIWHILTIHAYIHYIRSAFGMVSGFFLLAFP